MTTGLSQPGSRAGRRLRWALALSALGAACGCSLLPPDLAELGAAAPSEAGSGAPFAAAAGAPVDVAGVRQQLRGLPVKGRAPKTGYDREQFGPTWADVDEDRCDSRNQLLQASLTNVRLEPGSRCVVLEGDLADPYTGRRIHFVRGGDYANGVDVDHLVALGDAWQKGAQQLTAGQRLQFANDPQNLRAVDPSANRQKGDSDAASWLPPNKAVRCSYVAGQVAVKVKYELWITRAERDAVLRVLQGCAR